jgi:general secretion pathway protein G
MRQVTLHRIEGLPKGAFSRAFTLVELLVVIAILGLLAGLVGPQVLKQFASAKVDAAQLQIADLGAGLDLFLLDIGRYPSSTEGLEALVREPGSVERWDGPYLKKSEVPADPWGRPFLYSSPGEHGLYDLVSLGADGKEGGSADATDIASWEL